MSLDDISWGLLDKFQSVTKIPVSDFFYDRNLPPLLFPALILVLLTVTGFLFLQPSGGPAQMCGDGLCGSGETCTTCPQDCGQCTGATLGSGDLVLEIKGKLDCSLKYFIYDENDNKLSQRSSTKSTLVFRNIQADEVYVKIEGSGGKVQKTDLQPPGKIEVRLDEGICDAADVGPSYGSFTVTVTDSVTYDLLDAEIRVIDQDTGIGTPQDIEGQTTVDNLMANKFYKISAVAQGYSEKVEGPIFLIASQSTPVDIYLEPISGFASDAPSGSEDEPPPEGLFTACVVSDGSPVSEGKVAAYYSGSDMIAEKTVDSTGCASFEVDGGRLVYAAVTTAPSGCTASGQSSSVEVVPGGVEQVTLDAVCTGEPPGYVTVTVYDIGREVLTDEVTVTLWSGSNRIMGSNPDGSLAVLREDTEELEVAPGSVVYAKATDVPPGYFDTISETMTINSGEHKTIELELDGASEAFDRFSFTQISVSPNPAPVNEMVGVKTGILFDNETMSKGEVKCLLGLEDVESYPAAFDASTNLWGCTFAALSIGDFPLVIEARYNGKVARMPLSDLKVRNYLSGALKIEFVRALAS